MGEPCAMKVARTVRGGAVRKGLRKQHLACRLLYFVYDDAEQGEDDEPQARQRRTMRKQRPLREDGIVAFDLGIKTLATGYTDQGRFYHIGGFKGYRWYNKQLDKIRSKRDKCKKQSRRYLYLSKVYQRVSEQKRSKQRDCLHKASHLIAHRLAERAVVIGDLSQQQMVIKQREEETPKERRKRHIRNRMVYNDWGSTALYRCLPTSVCALGKNCISSMSAVRPNVPCLQMQKRYAAVGPDVSLCELRLSDGPR